MTADKPKVLIVDDEKNYLEDFLSLFSRKFEILTAASGEEGLKILENETVGVIVSDQRMPSMSGAEFLGEASKKYPDTVRILLTGYSDLEAVVEAVNKGEIYRYVTKDTPLKEIEIIIRQGMERYLLEESNRLLLAAKQRLLKSLAVQENLSVVGTFGQQIHQRMESMVMHLFDFVFQMRKEGDEKKVLMEFQRLQGALSRLRELSSFSEAIMSTKNGLESRDLNLFVTDAAQRASRAAADKKVEIKMELAKPALPEVPVHPYSFQRVLKELLENAILFGGKRIVIRTRFEEGKPGGDEESLIRVEVSDNGKGIPDSEIPKTFAPFYSSFSTTQPEKEIPVPQSGEYNLGPYYHYGFGLPIAQWIVCLRHSGTIELKSQPGKGTTATLTIPVIQRET